MIAHRMIAHMRWGINTQVPNSTLDSFSPDLAKTRLKSRVYQGIKTRLKSRVYQGIKTRLRKPGVPGY